MNFRQDAMSKLYPTWATIDGDTDVKDKDGKTIVIDESKITEEVTKLQKAYDDLAYTRNRQADYPDWGTQLDKIYDDGLTKWKSEMVDPVKAKWPKDNSGPK
jgi:hypothetical protein